MVTRPMTRADVRAVQLLAEEAQFRAIDIDARFDALSASARDALFVAERDGTLVGFAHAHGVWPIHMPPYASVVALVVAAAARRQGVGTALLAACREWAVSVGYADLRLP